MESTNENLRPDELLAQLGWVRALARGLVADPGVTDDVLQQVCLLALQQAPREASAGPRLRAWLATVTRNLVRNGARADLRRVRREQAVAQPEALPSTDEIAARREALRSLMDAVTSLEEPYFSVIVERYFDGLSVAEIATRHDTSPAAVRQQLSRARQQLRTRLQSLLADDRQGWLAATLPLAPVAVSLKGAPVRSLLAQSGGLLVAKSVSTVATAICIGLVLVACLLVGGWYGLREIHREPPQASSVVQVPEAGERERPGFATEAPTQPLLPAEDLAGASPIGNVPTPTTGRLLVHVTWATDGRPAPDVAAKAVFWDMPEPLFNEREGLTDAAGRWELPDCPPGKVTASFDRAQGETVQVRAGETTELRVAIPAGVLVRGLVVDVDERPVPGAGVWICLWSHGAGSLIARADDRGRFTLRDMREQEEIGARLDGHLPSPLVRVSDSVAHVQDVILRLGGAGAQLQGHVLDAQGAAVANALVVVGPDRGWPAPDESNRLALSGPPARWLRADAEGAFTVRDLPRGSTPLAARSRGHSPWLGTCELQTGVLATVDIVMPDSATAAGIVSDANGRPVAGAHLVSGHYGEIDWVETTSDAEGRYQLADLALGSTRIGASMEENGKDAMEFTVTAGARLHWDPQLTKGLQIVGRVLDAFDAPVAGLHVDATCYLSGRTVTAQTKSDAQGRFTLDNCGDGVNEVKVFDASWKTMLASQRDVRPGPDEVVLHVMPPAEPSAFLVGHLVDGSGLVPELANAFAADARTGMGASEGLDPATGAFRCGPLAPGEWDLFALAKGHTQFKVGRFTLVANETRDVGTITLPEPGHLRVRVRLGVGVPADRVFCALSAKGETGGRFLARQDDPTVWVSDPLDPGEYVVGLWSGSGGEDDVFVVSTQATALVEAGREAQVELLAERGTALTVQVETLRAKLPAATVIVTDAAGTEVLRRDVYWNERGPGHAGSLGMVSLIGRPGPYRVKVECDGKVVVEHGISLPAGVNIGPDVRVTLP